MREPELYEKVTLSQLVLFCTLASRYMPDIEHHQPPSLPAHSPPQSLSPEMACLLSESLGIKMEYISTLWNTLRDNILLGMDTKQVEVATSEIIREVGLPHNFGNSINNLGLYTKTKTLPN